MKRYSTSLITRKMQTKTTVRYYLTPIRIASIKTTENNIVHIGKIIYPKAIKVGILICTHMFIAALFTVTKGGSSTNVHIWMDGQTKWCTFHEKLFSFKKNVMTRATKWMNLKT